MVLRSVIVLALVMMWFCVEAKKPIGVGRRFHGIGNLTATESSLYDELTQPLDDSNRRFWCGNRNSRYKRDEDCCLGGIRYCPFVGHYGCHALLKLMKRKYNPQGAITEKMVAVGSTVDQHLVGLFIASSLQCTNLDSLVSSEYYVMSCQGEKYRLVDVLFHPKVRGDYTHDLALVYFDRKYNPYLGFRVIPRTVGPPLAHKRPTHGKPCFTYTYPDTDWVEIEVFTYKNTTKFDDISELVFNTTYFVTGPKVGNAHIGVPLFCDFKLAGLLVHAEDQSKEELVYLAMFQYYKWVHENTPYPMNRVLKSNAYISFYSPVLYLVNLFTLWYKLS